MYRSVSVLCCVCVLLVSVVNPVRYDGGAVPPGRVYIEYQNARPVQGGPGQQTRVFTFPHTKDYFDRVRFETTTRGAQLKDDDGDDDDQELPPPDVPCCGGGDREIPLELIMQLNELKNVSELWQFVSTDTPLEDGQELPMHIVANRFGGDADVERSSAVIPKPATCMPELTTVPLVPDDATAAGVFYFPSCTRVNRCGGCCSHSLLSCQPVQTEQLSFQVIKSEFGGGSKLSYSGREVVLVEQHTKCKCDCIVKEEHCNQFQEYRKNECRCACTNTDDEQKCLLENAIKLWDPQSCVCQCRETLDCTSGSYFDQSTCQCVQIPSRTFGPGADRTRFKVKPIPVETHDDEKYEV